MTDKENLQFLERCLNLTEPQFDLIFEDQPFHPWKDSEAEQLIEMGVAFESLVSTIDSGSLLDTEKILRDNFPVFWNKICKPGKEVNIYSFENLTDD